MQDDIITSSNLIYNKELDIKLRPTFDFEKFGISAENIIEEVQLLALQNKEAQESKINSFPVDVFPSSIQQIIRATNENLNFPIDFIGASLIYAVSVAVGNTHRIEVKKGWLESAVLYLAIVARAGTNKSHPLSFALHPIIEEDKRTYRLYEEQRQEYNKTINLSKKEREYQVLDEPIKPVWQKFLISDFTPEALTEVHKFNKRGIGVYVDELAGWFKNFNRYNKGSEMEFWLSVWSGKPINIDRKSGEPVFIPLPFISVAGTIQNGVLNELAKESRTQNGFIDRILFVIPDNIQKSYWNDSELNPIITQNWQSILSNLMNLSISNDDTYNPNPQILKLSPEAKLLLFEWQKINTDQCNNSENESVSSIYSKLEVYAIRLAFILEMMRFSCNESDKKVITVESVQGALKLVDYFKQSALKVNSIISNTNPLGKYPIDKQNLFNALPSNFNTDLALQFANSINIPERTLKRFLSDKELFNRISWGEYEKAI